MSSHDGYPPTLKIFTGALKEICLQAGLYGTLIVVAAYPFYNKAIALLESYYGSQENDAFFTAILASFLHTIAYVIFNGFFTFCDSLELLRCYKLHRKPYMLPNFSLVLKTIIEAVIGQALTFPGIYYGYATLRYFGFQDLKSELPSYISLFFAFCWAHVFNDVAFYFTHRLLHLPPLYGWFHKQHHEFKGTISIAAEYSSPIEFVISNLFPTFGGIVLWGAHPLCFLVWTLLRLEQTYEAHSGYCFHGSWLETLCLTHANEAAHHDYHHTRNLGNYGVGEYMDWLCGTMDSYVAEGCMEGYATRAADKAAS